MNQVYKITNKINGKMYIGITTKGIWHRWVQHVYRFNLGDRDHKLYLAMKKHGIENFDIETLKTVRDRKDLKLIEIKYIKELDTFQNGYNMTRGGDTVSEGTRRKLSKIFKGRKITWYKKILESRRLNGNPPGGIIWTGDHPQIGEYRVKHPDGKIERFKGLRIFCRKHGLSHNLLLATLKGVQSHHKGFVLMDRFNDYRVSEYTQAGGNGGYPEPLPG